MNKVPFNKVIHSEEELRSILGEPSKIAGNKVITKIDPHCETLIKHSPFLVLSTSSRDGKCDASPRGDAPGFVYIVDEKHVIIPERPGNKRVDSLQNIISNPHVGLLFFIPGMEETLRINGKAFITQDEDWLEKMAVNDKEPLFGIVVEVEEIFMHCAKAFKRSNLWNTEYWPNRKNIPTMSEILNDHLNLEDMTVETIHSALKDSYANKLY